MPKQKKKRVVAGSAPCAISAKTNDTSKVLSVNTEIQNSESLRCDVCIVVQTINFFDLVVLDTRRQLQVLAQDFQVVPPENVRVETEYYFSKGSIAGNNLLPNTSSSSKTPED